MNETLKRTARTFVQALLGSLVTSGVLSSAATSGVVDWSGLKKTGIAALSAGIVALITFVQNALEDSGTIPTIGKG